MLALPTSPAPAPERIAGVARPVLLGILAYGAVAPLLAIIHELIVLGTAYLISDLTWMLTTSGIMRALPLDPIYTGAMLLTLGGIEPRGLALAAPLGGLLDQWWSAFFEPPALMPPAAWVSAVVAPGATIVSRWLCTLVADAALLGLGLLAVQRSRRGHGWLGVAGAIVQAQVVVAHLVGMPPVLADVEAAGIPFAIAMLVDGDVEAGPRLAASLAALSEPVRGALFGLVMVLLAYLPVLLLANGWRFARVAAVAVRRVRGWRGRRGTTWSPSWSPRSWCQGVWSRLVNVASARSWRRWARRVSPGWASAPATLGRTAALWGLALSVALSPLGSLADAETRFLSASVEDPGPEVADAAQGPLAVADDAPPPGAPVSLSQDASGLTLSAPALAAPPNSVSQQSADGPSVVAVTGSAYRYQYMVNGVPQVIRGMGYNVRYRRLPDAERAQRLDRDFAALRRAGVNTVFGWEPSEFDEVLLDAAQRNGLGVAPPFELSSEADYGDPAVRERVTSEVLAWVERHRAHPALRMWAIGNEVLHKLVYPSWMPLRSDPEWEQRARQFAAFYVTLIDRVHAADPYHPIVHRDAEDAYLTWLRDALAVEGHRPWFVYGVNAYTPRLAEILTSWPKQGWDVPLLVSEFAPGGMSPADRPHGFREMWKMIRGANGWVIGGSAYTWTTDGPEEVDRVFGLVDADGSPVDGALTAITSMYRGIARQSEREATRPGEPRDERVWSFARRAIQAMQAQKSAELSLLIAASDVMGDLSTVSRDAAQDRDISIERVRDPRRVAWAHDSGVSGEWWVTWLAPGDPRQKLTFVIQEREQVLGIRYIYHGPR